MKKSLKALALLLALSLLLCACGGTANEPKPGCRFAARCNFCTEKCIGRDIPLNEVEPGHFVACTLFEK